VFQTPPSSRSLYLFLFKRTCNSNPNAYLRTQLCAAQTRFPLLTSIIRVGHHYNLYRCAASCAPRAGLGMPSPYWIVELFASVVDAICRYRTVFLIAPSWEPGDLNGPLYQQRAGFTYMPRGTCLHTDKLPFSCPAPPSHLHPPSPLPVLSPQRYTRSAYSLPPLTTDIYAPDHSAWLLLRRPR